MRRDIEGSRAIVTGASSGIGRAIARELARQGGKVVCMARREDRLKTLAQEIETAGGTVVTVAGDVTDSAVRARAHRSGRIQFWRTGHPCQQRGRRRDRAIRNRRSAAGAAGHGGQLLRPGRDDAVALPVLKHGRRPIIVNVSSILGRRGTPHNSEYAASKFAVHGFSESIRAELAASGVDVLVVSPGTTDTEFFDQVLESKGGPKWPEHKAVTAEAVARATVRAIRRGSHEITPYFWGKVLVMMNRVSPWFVDKLMARYA